MPSSTIIEHSKLAEIIVDIYKVGDVFVHRITVNRPFTKQQVEVVESRLPFVFCEIEGIVKDIKIEKLWEAGVTQISYLNQTLRAKTAHCTYLNLLEVQRFIPDTVVEKYKETYLEAFPLDDSYSDPFLKKSTVCLSL